MKPDGSIFGFASSWERTVKLRRNYNESAGGPLKMPICQYILCSVDRASLYNLVNKTNLVHNLFLVYLCTLHTRQSSTQNNKYQVSQKHSCFSQWWSHSRPKHVEINKYKGKAVPLQAWSGPESSRKLRLPDFTTKAQDGGKVVRLTHRPSLPPRKCSWYSFVLEAESTPGL